MEAKLTTRDRLYEHLEGLNRLLETTLELSHSQDLELILKIVTEGACLAHNCERASLYLYEETTGDLYTQTATELEIAEIRRELGESIVGWVAEQRTLANVPAPRDDPRWDSSIDLKTGYHTRNILAAPILSVHNGKLLGVLQLLNRRVGDFDEYDEELISAFASHAGTALERNLLLDEVREKHRLDLELNIGREIQTHFLPKSLPSIPGYQLAVWWEPAEAVSGDYYDFLRLPDNRLGLIVADVSGHGVGPSMIMATFRAMLKVLIKAQSRPSQLLNQLAATIYPDLIEGRFITAILVAICPATHKVHFANSAHAPAYYLNRQSGKIHSLETTGMPIGAVPDLKITSGAPLKMEPGDLLLLATDGIIELRNEQGEMFGTDRLKELLLQNIKLPADQIKRNLRQKVLDFHRFEHPPDDITLVILERKMH
jgi:serine phosphatase RsbU (regulator of sigma subunit)